MSLFCNSLVNQNYFQQGSMNLRVKVCIKVNKENVILVFWYRIKNVIFPLFLPWFERKFFFIGYGLWRTFPSWSWCCQVYLDSDRDHGSGRSCFPFFLSSSLDVGRQDVFVIPEIGQGELARRCAICPHKTNWTCGNFSWECICVWCWGNMCRDIHSFQHFFFYISCFILFVIIVWSMKRLKNYKSASSWEKSENENKNSPWSGKKKIENKQRKDVKHDLARSSAFILLLFVCRVIFFEKVCQGWWDSWGCNRNNPPREIH